MDIWVRVAQVLLSLSILIVLHEFGHFIPARLFKTKVEKFYLFFDWKFSLFKKKVGETEWGIGWLPLGGYVKISGMVDESMDTEQLAQPAQPWEFRSKPAWQRLIIMLGGIIVNVIVGFVLFIMVVGIWGEEKVDYSKINNGLAVAPYMEQYGFRSGDIIQKVNGEAWDVAPHKLSGEIMIFDKFNFEVKHQDGKVENITLPHDMVIKICDTGLEARAFVFIYFMPKIDSVTPKTAASKAGLKKGDKILTVNGKELIYRDELTTELYHNREKSVDITFRRLDSVYTKSVYVNKEGRLGKILGDTPVKDIPFVQSAIYTQHYGFGECFGKGFERGFNMIYSNVKQFKYVFTERGATQVGGVGTISKLFPTTWNWEIFWTTTAFLSMMLAVMNLLPIPALDGGHVMFLIYEMVARKPAPQRFMEYAQYAGFFILLGLMIYANGNDIVKWLSGS